MRIVRAWTLAAALAVPVGAQVTGAVADAETRVPIAGASVLAETASGTLGRAADADGRFTIPAPAGAVRLRVSALGYATLDTTLTAPARVEVLLAPAVTTAAEVVVQARRSETATRADAPVLLVPQSVAVVGRGVLDAQAARDARDALRNVPGAQADARGEPGAIPVLRGFQTDQTGGGVRRNGVEIPYLYDGLQANVERVEVLRGPASVLYGRLEPGGVVNFITETPGGQLAEVEAETGTLGSGRVAADVGTERGPLAARLNASVERQQFGRDEMEATEAFVAPAVRWRPSRMLTVDVDAEAITAETTIDPGLPAVGPRTFDAVDATPRERFHGEPDAVHRWRSAGLFTNADWTPRPGLGLRGGVSLARYRLDRGALDLDSLTAGGDVARSVRNEGLGFTYLKGTAFADALVRTGPVTHALTLGAEAIRAWAQADGTATLASTDAGLQFSSIPSVDLDAPQPTGVPPADVDYLDASIGGLDAGIFVQDRATLRLGRGAIHAVAAARVSHVRFNATVRALADTPEVPAGVSVRSASVTAVTPSAGLVVEPVPGLALYASTGTSFNPIVERVDRNGQPFEPTTGVQVEGGAKVESGWAAAAASVFWIRKDNALTIGPGGFADQTGRQRSRGVEVDARAQGGGLTALATYAYTDAEVIEDDNVPPGTPLAFAPAHAASGWVEIARGPLAVRAGAWVQGARSGTLGSSLTLPAAVTVDAGASLILPRVTLRLDARNLLGVRDYTAARTRPNRQAEDPLIVAWLAPAREVRLRAVVRPW
ncbi:MAG: TonB-dependent receptor [Bacteroidota bacterium]